MDFNEDKDKEEDNLISCYDLYNNKIDNNGNVLLINDVPLTSKENDLIDVEETVTTIYNFCVNVKTNESFAIGLIGPWGSGKTSIVKLVKERIDESTNYVIISDFCPWDYNDVEQMFVGLCREIVSKLNVPSVSYDLELYMKKYKKLLFECANNLLEIDFNSIIDEGNSITNVREEINKVLQYSNKQLVIVIDDFDRLLEDEILFLVKALNNLVNFDNVKYIVCYDEKNINQLPSYEENYLNNFFDKIFKAKVYVPSIDRVSFDSLFNTLATNLLKYYKLNVDNNELINVLEIISSDLCNVRDCIRFLNSLSLNMHTCMDLGLYVPDFIGLEYVKYKNSLLYTDIYNHISVFLKNGNYNKNKINEILLKNNVSISTEKVVKNKIFSSSIDINKDLKRCVDSRYVYAYFANKNNLYTRLNSELNNIIDKFNNKENIKQDIDNIMHGHYTYYDISRMLGYKIEQISRPYDFLKALLDNKVYFWDIIAVLLEKDVTKSIEWIATNLNKYEDIIVLFGIFKHYDEHGYGKFSEKIKNKCNDMLDNMSKEIVANNEDLLQEKYDLYSCYKIKVFVGDEIFKEYFTKIIKNENVMRMLASTLKIYSNRFEYDVKSTSEIVDIDIFNKLLKEIDDDNELNDLEKIVYSTYKDGKYTFANNEEIISLKEVRYKDFSKKK